MTFEETFKCSWGNQNYITEKKEKHFLSVPGLERRTLRIKIEHFNNCFMIPVLFLRVFHALFTHYISFHFPFTQLLILLNCRVFFRRLIANFNMIDSINTQHSFTLYYVELFKFSPTTSKSQLYSIFEEYFFNKISPWMVYEFIYSFQIYLSVIGINFFFLIC